MKNALNPWPHIKTCPHCGHDEFFWFGNQYLPHVLPQGESKPLTSKELEDILIQQIKKEKLANIKAFVMDVSPPEKVIKA